MLPYDEVFSGSQAAGQPEKGSCISNCIKYRFRRFRFRFEVLYFVAVAPTWRLVYKYIVHKVN